MVEDSIGGTLTEAAIQSLSTAIISGDLAPEAKLRVQELSLRLGIGATPVREALSRLVPLGLVTAEDRRGFRVAPISRADLDDLVRTRSLVEMEALKLAIENGDDAWEAAIVGLLHRMKRLALDASIDVRFFGPQLDEVHKQFHHALLSACGSPRLLALQSTLYDHATRYRRIMMTGEESGESFYQGHQRLADAVLARDASKACTVLDRHLRTLLKRVYPSN